MDQVPRGHEVLMKECIEIYQEFFVTFLSAKAFTGKNDSEFDPNGWLSKMVKRPNDTLEERTKYLEQLLQGTSKKYIANTDLFRVQVNLCQKLFFLQNIGRTCCVQKLFRMSETISAHNMFSTGLSLEFSCIELVIQ